MNALSDGFSNPKDQIASLKKEIQRLQSAIKREKYGLVWLDVPEAFEEESEEKIPVLKEVEALEIKNNDGKPTNILIEGENFHALTCLNYTHKGKIDVIYIDPPYNTGSDGFRYKDKRFLKEFPDGTEVPKDHPLRHSYWLSFMSKRLKLAKNLLKDDGVIFISIDDNEMAQLKLLCDEIFSNTAGKGFMGVLIWQRAKGGGNSKKIIRGHDYILSYSNNDELTLTQKGDKTLEHIKKYKSGNAKDRYLQKGGKLYFINDDVVRRVFGKYEKGTERRCEYENLTKFKGVAYKKEIDSKLKSGELVLKKAKNGLHYICKLEEVVKMRQVMYTIIQGFLSEVGNNDLAALNLKDKFEYPKPVSLIKKLFDTVLNKEVIVLDFFAGSGTTGHAVLDLNNEDGGKRQFILCTNNENKICEDVCYPRVEKVINGYTNSKGEKVAALGGSLKYYRTAFVGKNGITSITDDDRIELSQNAGELLSIAENTLYLNFKNDYFQIFQQENKFTCIYFREELIEFKNFVNKIKTLDGKKSVYVFSWGNEDYSYYFENMSDCDVKNIPQQILEIYKKIKSI